MPTAASIEYASRAPDGRIAGCRTCKVKLKVGEVRVVTRSFNGASSSMSWHPTCAPPPMRKRLIEKDATIKVVGVTETEVEEMRRELKEKREKEKEEKEKKNSPSSKKPVKRSTKVFESDEDEVDSSSDEEDTAPPPNKQPVGQVAVRAPAKKLSPPSASKPTRKVASPQPSPVRAASALVDENAARKEARVTQPSLVRPLPQAAAAAAAPAQEQQPQQSSEPPAARLSMGDALKTTEGADEEDRGQHSRKKARVAQPPPPPPLPQRLPPLAALPAAPAPFPPEMMQEALRVQAAMMDVQKQMFGL